MKEGTCMCLSLSSKIIVGPSSTWCTEIICSMLGFSGLRAGQSSWWQDQNIALTVIIWLNQLFFEQNVSNFFLSNVTLLCDRKSRLSLNPIHAHNIMDFFQDDYFLLPWWITSKYSEIKLGTFQTQKWTASIPQSSYTNLLG